MLTLSLRVQACRRTRPRRRPTTLSLCPAPLGEMGVRTESAGGWTGATTPCLRRVAARALVGPSQRDSMIPRCWRKSAGMCGRSGTVAGGWGGQWGRSSSRHALRERARVSATNIRTRTHKRSHKHSHKHNHANTVYRGRRCEQPVATA